MQQALDKLRLSIARVVSIADDVDRHAQAALANADIQARHETTLAAAIVILSGFLESFLGDLAEAMVTEVCLRSIPFQDLPDRIRVTHFRGGGVVLQNMMREESKDQPLTLVESADIARRLASVNGSQPPYELVWEAFAETQGNPGPQTIAEFLRRFDIGNPLPTLANTMNSTESTLSLSLYGFVEIRNECAHTGRATGIITTSSVKSNCALIGQLATAMVQVLQALLTKPPYTPLACISSAPGPPAQPSEPATRLSGGLTVSQFLLRFVRRILRTLQASGPN